MLLINQTDITSRYTKILTPGKRVGIMMKRNKALLSVLYQCFIHGVTYVPLDANWPAERIGCIVMETGLDTLYTSQELSPEITISDSINVVVLGENDCVQFSGVNHPAEIAYILYTSGTTGKPKGVAVTRDALLNFIEGIEESLDYFQNLCVACVTSITFDIFFLESIMALYKGLTVALMDEQEQQNPRQLARLLANTAIDIVQMTPSRLQMLINTDKQLSCLKNVKEILVGGEAFPHSLLQVLQKYTEARIYNLYGPTEATIWATISDLTDKCTIDIGRPLKNISIFILDEKHQILAKGQVGEICIAGKGLAKEYVGDSRLTAEKFIHLPEMPSTRTYCTGDLGRYLSDGSIEYWGRLDNEIKVRGQRISPEEIEYHLDRFEHIQQSVVATVKSGKNDKALAAFYTSDIDINPAEIYQYLASRLPSNMIPVIFHRVETFIQTEHGKVDQNRLEECSIVQKQEPDLQRTASEERTALQKNIWDIILHTLNKQQEDDISMDTNLASIGFDSVNFITMIIELENELNFEFNDEMLLMAKFSTIGSLIDYVESEVIQKT